MKNFGLYVLIILVGFLLSYLIEWWAFVVVCFVIGYNANHIWESFYVNFLAIFTLWWISVMWIDWQSNSILTEKVAILLGVGSVFWVEILASLIGGLLAGFAGMSGKNLQNLIVKKRSGTQYEW